MELHICWSVHDELLKISQDPHSVRDVSLTVETIVCESVIPSHPVHHVALFVIYKNESLLNFVPPSPTHNHSTVHRCDSSTQMNDLCVISDWILLHLFQFRSKLVPYE